MRESVGDFGCGGVQPAVLAAVEWSGVTPAHLFASGIVDNQGATISRVQTRR